ncbi:thiamine pyrophosphate-dependent enzyme [Neobacillus niacini]|uniref:thiamine pyrophosphate-dependent enzyme n=1 Tax=Neobacillus niacini TaxID=86668 RepID=UPI0021CAEC27|nr:thiamine pyrophosphate-dependent enzyme [Neobacillus niacini]MCM3766368.1 thiamine pyrophosphate-binding protein [Neobacillus niacini]
MNCTGAQAVMKCLELEGITHVFGVPGEQVLDLVDATYDSTLIEFVSARHEGGASFMAEAFGKTTGKPAVCIATAGVGASQLTIGIHTAKQDSTPMLVIIGQVNSKHRGREAWQEIDIASFFSHIAKYTVEINDASRIPEIMNLAISYSKAGRPGPVVVSIPEDILAERSDFTFFTPKKALKPGLGEDEASTIISFLNCSKRPLIIAGGGIVLSDGREELVKFSELSGIPVMSAFRRHDCFPNDHAHYLGNMGLGTFPEILETIKEADLIFAIGTRLSEITTQKYTFPAAEQMVIHIDIDHSVLLNQPFSADLSYQADAKKALQALNQFFYDELINHRIIDRWVKNCKYRFRSVLSERKEQRRKETTVSFSMEKMIDDLHEILPADSIITSDAGTFYTWFTNYFLFKGTQRYLGPTSGTMGYGLPSGLAAKMVYPDRPVITLSGDGGFMMTLQEFETAVRYNLSIISLVFNNQAYGAIRLHQERRFPNRLVGSDLGNPPFDELGVLFGGYGCKVRNNDEFKIVMDKALRNRKPTIIEIPLELKTISASSLLYKGSNELT